MSARSWAALQTGSTQIVGAAAQQVTSSGGDPAVAAALDFIKPLCDSLPAADEPGTATYSLPAGSAGLHLLGGVTITATITVTGTYPELVGRLWDVAPGGATRQIVELGAYRPAANQAAGTPKTATAATEKISFELPPNDYVVGPGHTVELELVGSNAPFFRPRRTARSASRSPTCGPPSRSAEGWRRPAQVSGWASKNLHITASASTASDWGPRMRVTLGRQTSGRPATRGPRRRWCTARRSSGPGSRHSGSA